MIAWELKMTESSSNLYKSSETANYRTGSQALQYEKRVLFACIGVEIYMYIFSYENKRQLQNQSKNTSIVRSLVPNPNTGRTKAQGKDCTGGWNELLRHAVDIKDQGVKLLQINKGIERAL